LFRPHLSFDSSGRTDSLVRMNKKNSFYTLEKAKNGEYKSLLGTKKAQKLWLDPAFLSIFDSSKVSSSYRYSIE
jgi:hypothetical protein